MKPLAAVYLLLSSLVVQSQKIPPLILDLSNSMVEQKAAVPFVAIRIIDARFDRSNVGCINKIRKANSSFVRYGQRVASFPDSLHLYLPGLLQTFLELNANSKDTLVLLVKQFHLSDRVFNPINLRFEPELLLRLSLSAFRVSEGRFAKLFSIDDLFSKKLPSDRIPKEEVMSDFRSDALALLLQQVLTKRPWQSNAAPFDAAVVRQGLQKRFSLPLFTDSGLRPGIYRSFLEFKQNTPSLTAVQLGINKDRLVSVKNADGHVLDCSAFWGVCTGKKIFIVFRGEFCELLPSDHSFYFLSYIRHSDLYGMPSFGDLAPQTGLLGAALQKGIDNRKFPHYVFLNMDEEDLHLEDLFGKSSLKEMQKDLLK